MNQMQFCKEFSEFCIFCKNPDIGMTEFIIFGKNCNHPGYFGNLCQYFL